MRDSEALLLSADRLRLYSKLIATNASCYAIAPSPMTITPLAAYVVGVAVRIPLQ
ncbi:MAG TPA: hypothetical protein V6D26_07520 [Stenomitos sp.]